MLSITSSAASVVSNVRSAEEVPDNFALRVFPEDTPQGTRIKLAFTDSPADSDLRTESEGTTMYVAAEVADALSSAVIDSEPTPQGDALVIREAGQT